MTEELTALRDLAHRKLDELLDEWLAEVDAMKTDHRTEVDGNALEPSTPSSGNASGPWTLDIPLSGSWKECERVDDASYGWPDGTVDAYDEFVTYEGEGDFAGMTLALGFNDNGDVVGFVLRPGEAKRGIVWFFPTDDFDETNEMLSMIRGGGPRKRSGFGRNERLPNGYRDFKTEVLRDRKAGKWNVHGVVAKADDVDTMLHHTALQAKLRGIA